MKENKVKTEDAQHVYKNSSTTIWAKKSAIWPDILYQFSVIYIFQYLVLWTHFHLSCRMSVRVM